MDRAGYGAGIRAADDLALESWAEEHERNAALAAIKQYGALVDARLRAEREAAAERDPARDPRGSGSGSGSALPADVAQWQRGYRDFGGPPAYEEHFINDVIPCESGWRIDPGNPSYIGPGQFDPGSWATASGATGFTDPLSWYAQGAAMAWWVQNIESPGGGGGWPHCWWRGAVP